MANPTWNDPIRGYFTQTDITHMKNINPDIDLGSYKSVVANAQDIYQMVSTGQMPPNKPWPSDWVENFSTWAQNNFPEN
jgi:hypothetical protein